ncbi:transcriptional protein SWT1 isoform X1 [Schistocerca americana]|uniref:transcriptional protein SWT1 isoform X1 n=2 Tax=Schistocerca americana TaxID=7009 RepID=UPI001F4FD9B3|nr:transcriptional protein SWT1 isoform X1 [Schistocerca americana]
MCAVLQNTMSVVKRKFVKRLNNDWEVYVSAKYPDKYFYFNLRTGVTTWEPPDPAEDVQIKQEEESGYSPTDPECRTLRVGCMSTNSDTKSPDNPHEQRTITMTNERCAPISGAKVVPTSLNTGRFVKEEPTYPELTIDETVCGSHETSDNSSCSNNRLNISRNNINYEQGKSQVQGTGRVKLKRRWVESEDSSASCDQVNAKKQTGVSRSSGLNTGQISHKFTASGSTQAAESGMQSNFTEKARKTGSVAGIAEQRLVRLRKVLEKQKTLSPRKNSNISATSLPEKRSPRATKPSVTDREASSPTSSNTVKQGEKFLLTQGNARAANTVPDRKVISPTDSITTKRSEQFSPPQGSHISGNIVSDGSRVSSTQNISTKQYKQFSPQKGSRRKKNVAANRLKVLQDQLKKDQKTLQGNQNKNVQPKQPICVVVHDSHRTNDEAEFLKAEEQMLMDVQELREEIHKAGGVNPEEIEEMICEIIPSSFPDTKSNLYIVSDTNVLVSNCQSIDKLCNTNVEGIGCPVFIIPWMVLHELDILKDRRDVTKSKMTAVRAQKAITFLHKCFSTKHPRVIGQTVSDAGPDALSGLCNPDNSILQCCLQQMGLGRKVLLLSDDKNLQNKCMVNGIDAVGKSDLKNYLEKLSKQNKNKPEAAKTLTSNPGESSFEESDVKVNILVTNLMHCAKEVLSKIIVQEMGSAYGDKWIDVICVKPPFSLSDIFTCLMQHWMAVFGLVMSKNSLATVKELKKLCESPHEKNQGCRISIEDVKNIAIRFARLTSEFVKPLYSKLIKEAQLYLENLISDCENPFSRSELKNSVTFSEPSPDWVVSKHLVVVENIRKICIALVELCQQLRMVIAHDQSLVQARLQVVLSEDDLKTWVSYFYGPVSNLYLIMESVAGAKEAQAMRSPEMVPVMDHMFKDFSELYRLISSGQQVEFTIEDMFSFFEDSETSDIFKEIKEQFHNCGVIMRQAVDHFSEKDLIPFSNNNSANNSISLDDVEMEEQFSDTDKYP